MSEMRRKREPGDDFALRAFTKEDPEKLLAQGVALTPHQSAAQTASPQGEAGIPASAIYDAVNLMKQYGNGERIMPISENEPMQLKTITDEDVHLAEATLMKYAEGKKALEERVKENQQWWRLRQWDVVGRRAKPDMPEPTSAWLFNSIANKHADFMDNYPSPVVLPRELADKQNAQTLTSMLPVIMEQNRYEKAYDDSCWDTLISGIDVQGVFWDKKKLNGLGDIAIKNIDVLNLYWEPGCTDIQESANVFHTELRNADDLRRQNPQLAEVSGLDGADMLNARYLNDENIDTSTKALVVDWYYKRTTSEGKTVLHYCKFCAGKLLYASENEPEFASRGYYDHGRYPFVVGSLFPIKDSLGGFGYVDIMKSPQIYIDKLDQAMLKNTVIGATPRFFVRNDGMISEEEYADLSKPFVHFTGSGNPQDSVFPIQIPEMNGYAITLRTNKVDELKETSANRDFSQGGTASGITAASAIAALQEAGSKTSRDMIKERYRGYREVVELCIELIRQFYDAPRTFRITGQQGQMDFVTFENSMIGVQQTGDAYMDSMRLPVFDVEVVAEKSSPFSTVVQNERAKELYSGVFFLPQNADQALLCLDMMQFDGIEEIKTKISQNSSLFKLQQTIAPMMMRMAAELDQFKGTQYTPQIQMLLAQNMPQIAQSLPMGGGQMGDEPQANGLGDALNGARSSTAGEARKKAANNATPR